MSDDAANENSTTATTLPEGASLTPPSERPGQAASDAAADASADEDDPEPVDDVGYLLSTFKVDDMSVRNADGTVDRKALDALLAAHRHLIADRIRFPGA